MKVTPEGGGWGGGVGLWCTLEPLSNLTLTILPGPIYYNAMTTLNWGHFLYLFGYNNIIYIVTKCYVPNIVYYVYTTS